MMKLSELQAMNHIRSNGFSVLIRILAIMVLPPFSLLFGAIPVASGIGLMKEANDTADVIGGVVGMMMGAALAYFGVRAAVKIFKGIMAAKKNTYRAFHENDVIVDACCKKLRGVDHIALERFSGALKPALCYVAESPDLSRRERYAHMIQWTDYERDYVVAIYGRNWLYTAKESRAELLTYSAVFGDLTEKYRKRGNKPFAVPPFRMVKATCVNMHHSVGIDGESDSFWLYFDAYGKWDGADVFHITRVGDEFYLVLVDGKKGETICCAYAAFEWSLDPSLESMVEK